MFSVVCNKPCAKNDASPFVVEDGISPVEVLINLNSFSPVLNVEAGIFKMPATSPNLVVVNLPIEYTEVASGVVVHADDIVAILVAATYALIVLC